MDGCNVAGGVTGGPSNVGKLVGNKDLPSVGTQHRNGRRGCIRGGCRREVRLDLGERNVDREVGDGGVRRLKAGKGGGVCIAQISDFRLCRVTVAIAVQVTDGPDGVGNSRLLVESANIANGLTVGIPRIASVLEIVVADATMALATGEVVELRAHRIGIGFEERGADLRVGLSRRRSKQ